MYLVKEMPVDQRPRERLIKHGAKALSNAELLAILLRTGYHEQSVIELSKHVLYHLSSLDELKKLSYHELLKIKGIKSAKATTILASIELGYRLSAFKRDERVKISSAQDVYHLLVDELSHLEQEHFFVLYLNVKSEVIKKECIYIGTINQMMIHPREIYKKAFVYAAAAMILVHNHPSGDSNPSHADQKATDHLLKTSEVMGIDLIDHIIIGHHEFYSIKSKHKTKID
ncbi:MAG: DNA repair protein RadC [Acholeplasmataceae bacterium]|nr:DNA repair protein RadC [Acholeplasmataceae bacterium]